MFSSLTLLSLCGILMLLGGGEARKCETRDPPGWAHSSANKLECNSECAAAICVGAQGSQGKLGWVGPACVDKTDEWKNECGKWSGTFLTGKCVGGICTESDIQKLLKAGGYRMCQTKDLTGWAHSSVLKQQCVTGGCAAAICVGAHGSQGKLGWMGPSCAGKTSEWKDECDKWSGTFVSGNCAGEMCTEAEIGKILKDGGVKMCETSDPPGWAHTEHIKKQCTTGCAAVICANAKGTPDNKGWVGPSCVGKTDELKDECEKWSGTFASGNCAGEVCTEGEIENMLKGAKAMNVDKEPEEKKDNSTEKPGNDEKEPTGNGAGIVETVQMMVMTIASLMAMGIYGDLII